MSDFRQTFKENHWFLLIVLFSLLLKMVLLLQGEMVNPDAATYIAAAEKYAQGLFGEGLHYYRMPFYPLLLAAVHFFISDWVLSGQLLTVVALVSALFPLYALTIRLFDQHTALWTALLFAVLPKFNTLKIIRDPLFLFFTLGALYFLVTFNQEKRTRSLLGFCMLAVLATLIRIEGILLFPIAAVPVLFYWWNLKGSNRNKIFALACFVLMSLVVIFSRAEMAGLTTALRLNEVTQWVKGLYSLDFFSVYQHLMAAIKQLQQSLPGGHLRCNLLETTRHYAPLIYCIGLSEILVISVFPTSLLAFLAFRWQIEEKKKTFRWIILLVWVVFSLLNILFLLKMNFIQTRYFWVPIVLTLPWIGYGIDLWWRVRATRKIIATTVVLLIFIAPLSQTVATVMKSDDMIIIEAGNWLRGYDPLQKEMVLYNDRRLALYADRVDDVKKVRELEYLRGSAQKNKGVGLVVLYLSKKKNEDYVIQGFKIIRIFEEEEHKVVFLKRN